MRRTLVVLFLLSVSLAVSAQSVTEGNSGIVPVTVTVDIPPSPNQTITGTYTTMDGTATVPDGDYLPASGSFDIPAGNPSGSTQTIVIEIIGDLRVETNETFTLLVDLTGAPDPEPFIITIVNDDVPVVAVSNPSIVEGNAGTTVLTFEVTMPKVEGTLITANYSTANVTATAGTDYESKSGTIPFPVGTTRQTVTVNVIGDTLFEPDETFSLVVTPTGGTSAVGSGTIVNDDRRPPASLTIVSGNNQSARLGQRIPQPLVVLLTDSVSQPVSGATIEWRVTRGAATLDPAQSVTNGEGRASTSVTVDNVGPIDVQASAGNLTVTFTLNANTSFETRATGPVAVPIARALDQFCARNEQVVLAVCRALVNVADADLTRVLERVAPQQSAAHSKIAGEVISSVTSGVRNRLSARRRGVQRFSINQLELAVNGEPIPFATVLSAVMQDAATVEDDYSGWSGFLSGSLGDGERSADGGMFGFELESQGLMVGVDRQFGESIFGLSANFMNVDAELRQGAGSVDTSGYALSLYGSRSGLLSRGAPPTGQGTHFDGVHIDGSVTLGRHHYDSEHIIDILGFNSVATSENDATIFAVSGVTGLELHRGRTDFDLAISGTWSRADIDDFSEEGAGPLVLFVNSHEIESLTGTASLSARAAFPVPFGTLLPSVRGELVREFKDSVRVVTARFLRDSTGTSFTIPIDRPDVNYGRVAAGLQGVFPYGVSAYIEVTKDVMRSDIDFTTIQFNVSKSF